jgi:hypothetical protein
MVRLIAPVTFLIPRVFSIPWKRNAAVLNSAGYVTFSKDGLEILLVCWHNYQ